MESHANLILPDPPQSGLRCTLLAEIFKTAMERWGMLGCADRGRDRDLTCERAGAKLGWALHTHAAQPWTGASISVSRILDALRGVLEPSGGPGRISGSRLNLRRDWPRGKNRGIGHTVVMVSTPPCRISLPWSRPGRKPVSCGSLYVTGAEPVTSLHHEGGQGGSSQVFAPHALLPFKAAPVSASVTVTFSGRFNTSMRLSVVNHS